MKNTLSPKELAAAIGVSESSLRRWVDGGAIRTTRTVGGHRRIPLHEAARFIRESHADIVRPELLGLSQVSVTAPDADDQRLLAALREGDAAQAQSLVISLYLAGRSIPALFDGPIRAAMQQMGELWRHDAAGILVEHRATHIMIHVVAQLRPLLPAAGADAPLALGGAPESDPYLLPSAMAALTLLDAGWQEMNFGPQTPVDLLADAAAQRKAKLVWLSLSVPPGANLPAQVAELARAQADRGGALVIGGRHSQDLRLPRNVPAQLVTSMAELSAFARGLNAKPAAASGESAT